MCVLTRQKPTQCWSLQGLGDHLIPLSHSIDKESWAEMVCLRSVGTLVSSSTSQPPPGHDGDNSNNCCYLLGAKRQTCILFTPYNPTQREKEAEDTGRERIISNTRPLRSCMDGN